MLNLAKSVTGCLQTNYHWTLAKSKFIIFSYRQKKDGDKQNTYIKNKWYTYWKEKEANFIG